MIELVYFIQNIQTENIKIGKSNNESVFLRLQSLNCATENDLKIIGIIITPKVGLERKLHKQFKKYKIKNEWFKLNDELLEYIKNKSISLDEFKEEDKKFRLKDEEILLKKIKYRDIYDNFNDFFNNYYKLHKDNLKFFYHGFLKISLQVIYEKMNKYSVEEINEVLKLNPKEYKFKKIKHHDEFTSEFKLSNFIIARKYEQYD